MNGLVTRAAALLIGLFASCHPSAPALAQTTSSPATIPLRFSLDYRIEGPATPFLVALDKGYFRAEGLDVTIDAAAGSLEPISRLHAGSHDMAFGDINALIRFRDANPSAAAKTVFMVYNRPPYAIIGRKSRGISAPKDLEGKKLGAPAADATAAVWPIFAKANNLETDKVIVENVGIPVRDPMLAAGQVDAITGYSFSSFIDLKDRGVIADDISVMLMADYGVKLYGNAILAGSKFATEHPDAVKGFLRAYLKALKDTIKNPAAAVDAVMKRNELAKKPVELERLRMAIRDNILTAEAKTNGFGAIDAARFEQAMEQVSTATKLKSVPKLSDVFDASYLPAEADRRAADFR